MVRVGIAGIGFMGVTHFNAYRSVDGAEVAAIFTRDPAKLAGDWRNVRGNFGEAGGVQDLSGVRAHSELDAILSDPEIDLLDICLPSYMHRDVCVRALQAGKHVLVEKPIALTVEDADAMIGAAAASGRLLMVAQVLRFWPEFALIRDVIEGGEHGEVLGAHFKRVISRPNWSGDDWFSDPKKTGGAVVDLHIHDTDFVQYLFGPPDTVMSLGVTGAGGELDYIATEYRYNGRNLCVSSHSGAIAQAGVAFEHGYDVYLERAMLRHNSASVPAVQLIAGEDQRDLEPRVKDAFVEQLQTVVQGVESGAAPAAVSGVSARNSLAVVLAEIESAKTGKPISPDLRR